MMAWMAEESSSVGGKTLHLIRLGAKQVLTGLLDGLSREELVIMAHQGPFLEVGQSNGDVDHDAPKVKGTLI
jgi:hypothetical protein